MSDDRRGRRQPGPDIERSLYVDDEDVPRGRGALSPGKRTLTSRLEYAPMGPVYRSAAHAGTVDPSGEHLDAARRTTGEGLPPKLRTDLEGSFDANLSQVRVHTDAASGSAATSMQAKAFTVGSDIFFAPSTYDPSSTDGQHLIAHEVAHTIQQQWGAAGSGPQTKLEVSEPSDPLEIEAERSADAFVRGDAQPVASRAPGPTVFRSVESDRAGANRQAESYYNRHRVAFARDLLRGLVGLDLSGVSHPLVELRANAGSVVRASVAHAFAREGSSWPVLVGFVGSMVEEGINQARGASASGTGLDDYDPAVAQTMASHFKIAIVDAVFRLLPSFADESGRLLALVDAGELVASDTPRPSPQHLAISRPIDRAVAGALCDGAAQFDVTAFRASGGACSDADPNLRTNVRFDFQRGDGSWRWLKVQDPIDATAAEVALALYGDPGKAYLLVPAPPLFGFSLRAPMLARHEQLWPGDAEQQVEDPVNALGDLRGAAALNQAGASQQQQPAPPSSDPTAVLDSCSLSLLRMASQAMSLGLSADAQALFVAKNALDARRSLLGTGDGKRDWSGPLQQQAMLLARAEAGIAWAVTQRTAADAKQTGGAVASDPAFTQPLLAVASAYVSAAAAADLPQTALVRLSRADQLRDQVPVQMMTLMLARSRQVFAHVEQTSASMSLVPSGQLSRAAAFHAAQERSLRQELATFREALAHDPVAAAQLMHTLPAKIDGLSLGAEIAARVSTWDALLRVVRDNSEHFPEPPVAGRWKSVGTSVIEDSFPTLNFWYSWTSKVQGGKPPDPVAERKAFDALVASDTLDQQIESVLSFLRREGSKKQLREFAGTAALLALTWFAGGVGAAGAATRTGGAIGAGAQVVRMVSTGRGALAGGLSAGSNLAGQAMSHGLDFDKYNWPSVGVDYVLGAVSHEFASRVLDKWHPNMFSREIVSPAAWLQFGQQQIAFALYGYITSAIRAEFENTSMDKSVAASRVEGVLNMIRSATDTSMLASQQGRQWFPGQHKDPRYMVVKSFITFVQKTALRSFYGTVPTGDHGNETEAETLGASPSR